MSASIFFEFNLPNAPSWFYISLFLVVGLFFKFNRVLSVRNWDLVALFALAPGLLLLIQADSIASTVTGPPTPDQAERLIAQRESLQFLGYAWLLAGSGVWLLRCLLDLSLVRRPSLPPNLNLPGLAWLSAALFVCLVTVAVRREPAEEGRIGKASTVLAKMQDGATAVVNSSTGGGDAADVEFWVSRAAALTCHLAVIAGLFWVGLRHFRDLHIGMGAVALYLLMPYTAYHVSQIHHIWPAALVLWAVAGYCRPKLSGALLGVAAGSSFFPLLLFPLWAGFYRGRGARRFAAAFAAGLIASLAVTGGLLLIDGRLGEQVSFALSLSDWQPWKIPQTESIWAGAHWAYRMPVFIAFAALMCVTAFWPAEKNLSHLIALSAALLLGAQFWYADRGGVYVLWYLPLLILMVFRPNLSRERLPEADEEDALTRSWPLRTLRRLLGLPDPGGDTVPPLRKTTFSTEQDRVRVFPPA